MILSIVTWESNWLTLSQRPMRWPSDSVDSPRPTPGDDRRCSGTLQCDQCECQSRIPAGLLRPRQFLEENNFEASLCESNAITTSQSNPLSPLLCFLSAMSTSMRCVYLSTIRSQIIFGNGMSHFIHPSYPFCKRQPMCQQERKVAFLSLFNNRQ